MKNGWHIVLGVQIALLIFFQGLTIWRPGVMDVFGTGIGYWLGSLAVTLLCAYGLRPDQDSGSDQDRMTDPSRK